ncbi:hypothetical protein GCM10009789_53110 [Kribbella sancticallisti]|uniref:Uncharacterized protein n=1 Tax=Kribbella sancticallisti TaxID=460087 RepID=A0ABP4PVS5_9ACTN
MVGEAVGRDRLVEVDEQVGEDGPDLQFGDPHRLTGIGPGGDWTEYPEAHAAHATDAPDRRPTAG